MVLLHGLGSNGSSWTAIAEALGESHRVYVPDMRGHGASDWPGTYSFELMRNDVLGFLDALGLDRVTLIGHSTGR
jgi:3-oxoadipate enol-lactonase